MNLAELSGSTRLFLVAIVCVGIFRDGFTVRDTWRVEFDFQFIIMLDTPFHGVQVELALSGDNHLFQFLGILHEECRVFLVNPLQDFRQFFFVARVHGFDSCSETRIRILDLAEFVMNVFFVQRIAVVRIFQFHGCPDVSGHHFGYFRPVLPGHGIQCRDAFFCIIGGIVQVIPFMNGPGCYFEIDHFTQMGFNRRVEHI